jgi:hypothetical protein
MLEDGYRAPWWAGYSYYDFEYDAQYLFPIPFNWLVRWWREAVYFLKWKLYIRDEKKLVACF